MNFSRMPHPPAGRFLSLVTLGAAVALAGCQRGQQLPEDQTKKLIEPVARVEVAPAAPAAAPAAPPGAEAAAAPAAPGAETAAAPAAAAPAPEAAAPAAGGAGDGKGIYDKTCVACHAAGVAGAPKLGDKAAWAPRIAAGGEVLLKSVIGGKGAMPPKGGNTALSDAEVKAAVEYMVAQSK
jgi:cytochrome c5